VAHAGSSRRRRRPPPYREDVRYEEDPGARHAASTLLDWGDDDTLPGPWGPIVLPRERPAAVIALEDKARSLIGLPRRHWLFCTLLAVAAVVRLIAIVGFQPGLWYSDSISYVYTAVAGVPGVVHPNGYPFLLKLLEPAHSITLVIALQHLMGLAMGIAVYAILSHRYRAPAWVATLAAVPPLLSAYAIQLEHFVLSDTLFGALIMLALVLALWNPRPSLKTWAWIGLSLGLATIVREQALLIVVAFALYRVMLLGRRTVAALALMGITFLVPLGAYAAWYDHAYGSFGLTSSTGAFLYGRVATFADCSDFTPPANEKWLCVNTPVSQRPDAEYYVWGANSPLEHGPAGPFSNTVNSEATSFALQAIEAQPLAYMGTVWHDTYMAFRLHRDDNSLGQSQNDQLFPNGTPASVASLATGCGVTICTRAVDEYSGGSPDTRLVQPFAHWIDLYQQYVVVPGPLLGLIVLAGLAGVILAWRRLGNPVLLPWLVGVLIIVTPAATASYAFRYVIAAVPPLCVAAALGAREIAAAWRRAVAARRDRPRDTFEPEPARY
jgi:hypothetical protein